MWTYTKRFAAHLGNDGLVIIPDQIAADQKHHDREGTVFPARVDHLDQDIMVKLNGDAYGLWTSGTGDCVVCEVE